MKIFISLLVVFIISFLLLFKLVYSGNKEEPEDEKLNFFLVILVSFLLALLPTAAIGLILFVVLGSANTVNMIFSLNISLNQLIVLAISFMIYLFTIDSILEIAVKHILGKNIFYYSVILLIRIGVFYMIGELVGLTQTVSVTFSTGVAFIILLIEILYNLREKHKDKNG